MGGPSGGNSGFGRGGLPFGGFGGPSDITQEQLDAGFARQEQDRLAQIDQNRAAFETDPSSISSLELREIVLQDLTRERIEQQEARLAAAQAPAPEAPAEPRAAVDRGPAERGSREPTLQGRRTGRRKPGATSIGNGNSLLGD
jgi:hypothetical protein